MKISGDLSIELRSQSKIKCLVAKCNNQLEVRGLAQWDSEVVFDDLPELMRTGDLVVTMMPDQHVKPFQSIVSLEGGDVATAFEHYFFQSEQLPTAIRLQVCDDSASGFMLQQMPQSSAREDQWNAFTSMLHSASNDLFTQQSEVVLSELLAEHDIELFPADQVKFKCHCSIERMENAIRTLGVSEAESILSDKQTIEVRCEYCNSTYRFDREAVDRLFNR